MIKGYILFLFSYFGFDIFIVSASCKSSNARLYNLRKRVPLSTYNLILERYLQKKDTAEARKNYLV